MPHRILRVLSLVFILLCPLSVLQSRPEEAPLQPRILLLVDGSSSMLQPWNDMSRFKAAGRIITAFMDSIYAVNPNVEFALRVYGHQSPAQNNDCYDSRLEVMFSKKNAVQMALRMNSIRPFGVSPIAYSLKEAATSDLSDELHNAYSIILITDGGESCGGNICDVVKQLIERKILFKPYIIGLVNNYSLKDQYACMGTYLQVTNEKEMSPAIKTIVDDYRPVLSVPIKPGRNLRTSDLPKPGIQTVPKPIPVPAPEWTPDRSESPRLNALAGMKQLKVSSARTPVPTRRPVPSVGKIYFNAEPVVIDTPRLRSSDAIARIQPGSTLRTVRTPVPAPATPRKRTVQFTPPTFPVEPPEQRSPEQIAAIPQSTDLRTVRLPAYQPIAPSRRSIKFTAPEFVPEPRDAEVITGIQPKSALRKVNTPAYQPLTPSKRSIQFTPPEFVPEPREPELITGIQPKSSLKTVKTPAYQPLAPGKRNVLFTPPVFTLEPRDPELITGIQPNSSLRTVRISSSQPPAPRKRSVQYAPPVFTLEPHEPEVIAGIQPALKAAKLPTRSFQAATTPAKRVIPALPRMPRPEPEPKTDSVVVVKTPPTSKPAPDTAKSSIVVKQLDQPTMLKPKPSVKAPVDNKVKEPTFTTERENANETSLSILFTDGRGKFYATTPQLQLVDPGTGKTVKQFYRTVDAAGNPDPQVVPPGTYNLVIAGRANMLMRRLVVEKDKKNRVIVKVPQGSLRFRYEDAPDRPVTEFEAIVSIRFEPGPPIRQRCTAELEYAPGNYYIEVNTMPISRFNTDIDFGATTEIQIPIPGFVQFTNRSPMGPISLYTPLGNKFVRFYGMQITGNQAAQRLQLKPGLYEVRWIKNPNVPYASETIEKFLVKSNSVTEVELR